MVENVASLASRVGDDTDIPWLHTDVIYWHAVNARVPSCVRYMDLEGEKDLKKADLGARWMGYGPEQRGEV